MLTVSSLQLVSSSFFPRLFSPVAYWTSIILPHMMWPYREFRMQMWNVMHVARWNTGRKNYTKNHYLCSITQLCWPISSQLRHVSTVRKNLLSSNICSTYPHSMVNGWDRFEALGHLSKFQWVSRLGFVTAPTSLNGGQPNFARCLSVSWAGALYIHF